MNPPPALLFTATHGVEYDRGHPDQHGRQGALLCQDWDGGTGEVPREAYLAAEDVTEAMNLQGMVLFFFACYGVGTPQYDDYYRAAFHTTGQAIADAPFVSRFAASDAGASGSRCVSCDWSCGARLGSLILVGHRRSPGSIPTRTREHVEVFAATLDRLLEGYPVGAALDYFNMRYAAVATELTYLYERMAIVPLPLMCIA